MSTRLIKILAVLGIAGMLVTGNILADDYDQLRTTIQSLAPGAKNISFADSPIDGLLEIQIDSEIVYTDTAGETLILGRMIDMATRNDLTELAKSRFRKPEMAKLDQSEQIVFAADDEVHELVVFTDIDCGYCRRLHAQVSEYNELGISIRYMAFPRGGITSASYDKAVTVWCSSDQRSALTTAKLGSQLEPEQCNNPVKKHYEVGNRMGITGTPALLTMEGQLIPGYVEPVALRARLDLLAAANQ